MSGEALTRYVALLRAVNVGGTGKLPMADLAAMCAEAGLRDVKTYIASGNVVFRSPLDEGAVRTALKARLDAYAGKSVGLLVRTAEEMAETRARNPFPDAPGKSVLVLFLDDPLPPDPMAGVAGLGSEELRLGRREIYIHFPDGMGTSKLRTPWDKRGTGRNMNTVAKLADMAAALG